MERIPCDIAEFGLLKLLIGYLDKLEATIKADQTVDNYEREVNRTLLIEIERKRQVFQDGMTFLKRKA